MLKKSFSNIRALRPTSYINRRLCSNGQKPKFEGGERNFWQSSGPNPNPSKPVGSTFGQNVSRAFFVFSIVIGCVPFSTAYMIETQPEEFEKGLKKDLVRFREAMDKNAIKEGKPRMTDEQFSNAAKRALAYYDPYISVLRALGITSKKEKEVIYTWDSDSSNSNSTSDFLNNDFVGSDPQFSGAGDTQFSNDSQFSGDSQFSDDSQFSNDSQGSDDPYARQNQQNSSSKKWN